MGVIYFLICVSKHESNLPSNIRTTVGEENTMIYRKMRLLSETLFLPYFMIAWCVFFYQSVCFFTNGVYHVFHQNIMCVCFLENSVGKKIHTLPRYDLIFPYQMT